MKWTAYGKEIEGAVLRLREMKVKKHCVFNWN